MSLEVGTWLAYHKSQPRNVLPCCTATSQKLEHGTEQSTSVATGISGLSHPIPGVLCSLSLFSALFQLFLSLHLLLWLLLLLAHLSFKLWLLRLQKYHSILSVDSLLLYMSSVGFLPHLHISYGRECYCIRPWLFNTKCVSWADVLCQLCSGLYKWLPLSLWCSQVLRSQAYNMMIYV